MIGGGDWASQRVVPDAIKSWAAGNPLQIRSPNSTRPWQHVLEPVFGYIFLAKNLSNNPVEGLATFNFGPSMEQDVSVKELVNIMSTFWPGAKYTLNEDKANNHEAKLLKLSNEKAASKLCWRPKLNIEDCAQMTVDWYYESYTNGFMAKDKIMKTKTFSQIQSFFNSHENC